MVSPKATGNAERKPIVLGTGSKYKIGLFQTLGLPFETDTPPFEENNPDQLEPMALAAALARGKAKSLVGRHPKALIIGADQVLALGDRVFSKPGTMEKAVAQLLALTGRTHCLHTAFAVFDPSSGAIREALVTSRITFHANLSEDFLRTTVAQDQSWDCVGSYKFESRGILLMEKVETSDTNAIVGLPLIALAGVLGDLGYFPTRFCHL